MPSLYENNEGIPTDAQLPVQPNWSSLHVQRARRSLLRNSIDARRYPGCSSARDGHPSAAIDPAHDILTLCQIRETLWQALPESLTHPAPNDSAQLERFQTLKLRICRLASATTFFVSNLYSPLKVLPMQGGIGPYDDLAQLVLHLDYSDDPCGLLIKAKTGTGKTSALWKLWHDCLLKPPLTSPPPRQLRHVPFWITGTDISASWSPELLVVGAMARSAGLWRSETPRMTRQDRSLLAKVRNYHLRCSPPLIVMCDLDSIPPKHRGRVAEGMDCFQQESLRQGTRHISVLATSDEGSAWEGRLGGFHRYALASPDAAFVRDYPHRYREFTTELYGRLGLEPPTWEPNRVTAQLDHFLCTPDGEFGIPLLMQATTHSALNAHAAGASVPPPQQLDTPVAVDGGAVECIDRAQTELEVLWELVAAYQDQSLPPVLAQLWERWETELVCEYVLRCFARDCRMEWNSVCADIQPYIETRFAWLKPASTNHAATRTSHPSGSASSVHLPARVHQIPLAMERASGGSSTEQHVRCRSTELDYLLRQAMRDRQPVSLAAEARFSHESLRPGARLVVTEDASFGKTVFTWRLVEFLCDPCSGTAAVFHGHPPLVFRCENRHRSQPLPGSKKKLVATLAKALQPWLQYKPGIPRSHHLTAADVVTYAIARGRFVLILDAVDQASEKAIEGLLSPFLTDRDWRQCHVIVTGRAYVFSDHFGRRNFPFDRWTYATILPFNSEEQRAYLAKVLPGGHAEIPRDVARLLEVPGHIAMVRDLVHHEGPSAIQEIRTVCDLMWTYLKRVVLRRDSDPLQANEEERELWEVILSVTAFLMVLGRRDGYKIEGRERLASMKADVFRYCRALLKKQKLSLRHVPKTKWNKIWSDLPRFSPFSERSIMEANQSKTTFAWRHKSWMEFFAGLFLARYAHPCCLRDGKNDDFTIDLSRLHLEIEERIKRPTDAADAINPDAPGYLIADTTAESSVLMASILRQLAFDPSWYWAWRCALDFPQVGYDSPSPDGAASLASSLAALFAPPPICPGAGGEQRCRGQRPSELIYRAVSAFRRVPVLKPAWEPVRKAFQKQFGEMQSSSQSLLGEIPNDRRQTRTVGHVAQELLESARPCPPGNAREVLEEGLRAELKSKLARLQRGETSELERLQSDCSELTRRLEAAAFPAAQVAFSLQATTVTVEQFCVLYDPGHYQRYRDEFEHHARNADSPVIMVSWYDAFAFALLVGARLPTPAEWQWACFGGRDDERDSYGVPYRDPDSGELRYDQISPQEANFSAQVATAPVVQSCYPPNDWGLHQMHGNVWEWCEDASEAGTERSTQPVGGGGFDSAAADCTCRSFRFGPRGDRYVNVGFRLVFPSQPY